MRNPALLPAIVCALLATAPALARVPWSKVGSGWVLAEYTTGPAGKAAPVT